MNKAPFAALLLLGLAALLPVPANAQQAPYLIKNISPSVTITPDYQITTGEAKRSIPQKWLEIEVEFSSSIPTTPELVVKYYVLLNTMPTPTLLTGEVTHENVPAGQSLFSIMYITPNTLASYLKGQPLTPNFVRNVEVDILKPGVGAPVAARALQQYALSTSPLPQVSGLMLNKNQTPFAPLYWDRYQAIKPPEQR